MTDVGVDATAPDLTVADEAEAGPLAPAAATASAARATTAEVAAVGMVLWR
ncbi:MAG TPA: hypothetical protein VES21_09235 [Nocardioidaceae bacterium]|nr:hypothetical protein [Nocardioidaceae bacterium]